MMQKQSFTVHWGADNSGDMLFMEVSRAGYETVSFASTKISKQSQHLIRFVNRRAMIAICVCIYTYCTVCNPEISNMMHKKVQYNAVTHSSFVRQVNDRLNIKILILNKLQTI